MKALQASFDHWNRLHETTVGLDGRDLPVLVARTPSEWAKGLTGRADDIMLFELPAGSRFAFHMAGVDHDLTIGFYDPQGACLYATVMAATVGHATCPVPYRYALEAPSGTWAATAIMNRSPIRVAA